MRSLGLWRWTRHWIAVVDGRSMEPALRAGDRLLIRRCTPAQVRRGAIVVAREPLPTLPVDRVIVKRVVAVPGDPVPRDRVPALRDVAGDVVPEGSLVVLGDNPAESRDSREFGYLDAGHLLGVAVRPMR
ncbi:hypothetical protein GCM10010112_45320 [Actinoplanes lobatus]|uniref:Signal peptidase I n=1 Tax=Actinoplanes lobatus TaxID=113568 RepID=A0A7W7MH68_9ACTN|nr:S26 family signal peptidase [Actinoplanes lobatus]MBB4750016.1 signal peptidase I [Actinoplanes lobatus]GGN74790.1 hypothetical protein GCM10010112_45320 [Actinoplanes lobatus]GIE39094.1 hypothetical protein Alo02nite_19920 [Actinoplanes lobatus]